MAPEELHLMLSSVLHMCMHTWHQHTNKYAHTQRSKQAAVQQSGRWGSLGAHEALGSCPTGKGNGGGVQMARAREADKL